MAMADGLCALCHQRPGTRLRWWGDSSRAFVCERCDAAASARAVAWKADKETHAATWRCEAPQCRWSLLWSGSRSDVARDYVWRIARAQMLEHARAFADEEHVRLVRALWQLGEVSPSEVLKL
jgi:hypothetical protein